MILTNCAACAAPLAHDAPRCIRCHTKYCDATYGVVRGALGWACWKTYLGRPEMTAIRQAAMCELGNGLADAKCHEDALSVKEARLSSMRRLGASEDRMLVAKSNLADTYAELGRSEEAMGLRRDVYSGYLKLCGNEQKGTLREAINYATSLVILRRFEEAKALLRKTVPVARRVFGESHETTLRMRTNYARSLYSDDDATLGDLREAVTTLEDAERIARRVLGGAHPTTALIERNLRAARAGRRARENAATGDPD
jgi:tetratricopeptide (TPR) repeat protein